MKIIRGIAILIILKIAEQIKNNVVIANASMHGSEWLLFNAKWAISQLNHYRNKLHFNEMMNRPGFESTIYRTRGEHANDYTTDTVSSHGTESGNSESHRFK
jgi:hypothetical protein